MIDRRTAIAVSLLTVAVWAGAQPMPFPQPTPQGYFTAPRVYVRTPRTSPDECKKLVDSFGFHRSGQKDCNFRLSFSTDGVIEWTMGSPGRVQEISGRYGIVNVGRVGDLFLIVAEGRVRSPHGEERLESYQFLTREDRIMLQVDLGTEFTWEVEE